MVPKRRFLKGFLQFSGNKHITVKNDPKIVNELMQNFMELDMKKISDLKALPFEVWGLKTSLGQFGPKAFSKGLIKPLDENPSFNFQFSASKQDLISTGIMR